MRCAWLRCRTKELLSKPADSLTMEEAKTLLAEEEERGRQRRKRKGRIRELEEVRAQLAEKVWPCWGQHAWDVPCACDALVLHMQGPSWVPEVGAWYVICWPCKHKGRAGELEKVKAQLACDVPPGCGLVRVGVHHAWEMPYTWDASRWLCKSKGGAGGNEGAACRGRCVHVWALHV